VEASPEWILELGTDLESAVPSLRRLMPVTGRHNYMNTGTSGPTPLPALQTVLDFHRWFNEMGPGGLEAYLGAEAVESELRRTLAAFFNADVDEIALSPGTSQGVNTVFQGFDWGPDDVILAADTEHDGILLPAYVVRDRYGVKVELLKLLGGQDPLEALAERLKQEPPTLLALSQVAFNTGQLLPLKEMVSMAHDHGVPVLVDSAQSVGVVPVDLRDLNAEFTAFTGHKWMLAPEGAGALHVRRDWVERLKLGAVGWGSRVSFDLDCHVELRPTAQRFEVGTKEVAVLRGWVECLRLLSHFGMPAVSQAILNRSRRLHEELSPIPGVSMALPTGQVNTGLLSFSVSGLTAPQVVSRLYKDWGIISRYIPKPFPDWVRLSVNFFQTDEELSQATQAIRQIAADVGG
jgi:L-cysteine/cystine lyase